VAGRIDRPHAGCDELSVVCPDDPVGDRAGELSSDLPAPGRDGVRNRGFAEVALVAPVDELSFRDRDARIGKRRDRGGEAAA